MKFFQEFLAYELGSIDGVRDSFEPAHQVIMEDIKKRYPVAFEKMKHSDHQKLREYNRLMLKNNLIKKFRLMAIRTKISYSAFKKQMGVTELFLHEILEVYEARKKLGLIKNPYPVVCQNSTLMKVINGNSNITDLVLKNRSDAVIKKRERLDFESDGEGAADDHEHKGVDRE